jgi:hypothetical protein
MKINFISIGLTLIRLFVGLFFLYLGFRFLGLNYFCLVFLFLGTCLIKGINLAWILVFYDILKKRIACACSHCTDDEDEEKTFGY